MLLAASAALTSASVPVSVTVLPLKLPPRLAWLATDSEPLPTDSVTLNVSLSSLVAGAPQVDYTIDFTTSATGQLADGYGTVTFTAPSGTQFPALGCVKLTLPNDGTYWCMNSTSGTRVATGYISRTNTPGNGLSASQAVELTLRGVTNSGLLTPQSLSVSTSSDTVASSSTFTTTTGRATNLSAGRQGT